MLRNGWARRLVFGAERALLAGIIAHYLARKRWIEIQVREALRLGIRQVVVLGAGFDTLAGRLAPEFPEVLFLELDHPATQAVKRKMPEIAPNLRFLHVDLTTQSLPADACPDFSKNRPSIIIAEGLTMYLTANRVAALLENAAQLAGPGGQVIFTFMEQAAGGSIAFHGEHPLVARWLKSRREPFLWGISRDRLSGWVEENGLHCEILASDRELRGEILAPRGLGEIPLARGECLCSCSPLVR